MRESSSGWIGRRELANHNPIAGWAELECDTGFGHDLARIADEFMAYRLKPTQSLKKGLTRILRKQIDGCWPVPVSDSDQAVWIHETRKSIKRMRALLRLARSGLGRKDWRHHDRRLRDAARELRHLRESTVLSQTIKKMSKTSDLELIDSLSRLDRSLETTKAATTKLSQLEAPATAIVEVARRLSELRQGLSSLTLDGDEAGILAQGLRSAHDAGQKWLVVAERTADDEALHELRKAIQMHWRQTILLRHLWPDVMTARVNQARDCAEWLGDHQDLSDLIAVVSDALKQGFPATDAKRIRETCRRAQSELRDAALPLAQRLFAADPDAYAAEILQLWHISERSAVRKDQAPPVAAAIKKNAPTRTKEATGVRPSVPSKKARSSKLEKETS